MYRVQYENLSPEIRAAVGKAVPADLNTVVAAALSIGEHLIEWCFGADAKPGGSCHKDFDSKRKTMHNYLREKCEVITFVGRQIPQDAPNSAFAFMRRCCWHSDSGSDKIFIGGGTMTINAKSDFLPSGVRLHLFPVNFGGLGPKQQLNTIAHELTHRVIDTTDRPSGGDLVYGWDAAMALRNRSSELALKCAENWGFFYQNIGYEVLPSWK